MMRACPDERSGRRRGIVDEGFEEWNMTWTSTARWIAGRFTREVAG
jgi:hypothetical protein